MSEVEDRSSGLGNANPDESATAKKERTPAQLESLARAREKAAEVRAKNTALRRKERELVNAQLAETRRLREETIEREHAERFHPKDTQSDEAPLTSQEEETGKEVVYQKKPQKRRVVVVQQQSSEEEEEIEIQMPKQKKAAPHTFRSGMRQPTRRTFTVARINECLRCNDFI